MTLDRKMNARPTVDFQVLKRDINAFQKQLTEFKIRSEIMQENFNSLSQEVRFKIRDHYGQLLDLARDMNAYADGLLGNQL